MICPLISWHETSEYGGTYLIEQPCRQEQCAMWVTWTEKYDADGKGMWESRITGEAAPLFQVVDIQHSVVGCWSH